MLSSQQFETDENSEFKLLMLMWFTSDETQNYLDCFYFCTNIEIRPYPLFSHRIKIQSCTRVWCKFYYVLLV